MRHVYPQCSAFASDANAEPDADIDLSLAGAGRLERLPCTGDIREQCESNLRGSVLECHTLRFNSPMPDRPSENTARHHASAKKRVRPGKHITRMTDIGARP